MEVDERGNGVVLILGQGENVKRLMYHEENRHLPRAQLFYLKFMRRRTLASALYDSIHDFNGTIPHVKQMQRHCQQGPL
jgi:hypothetical protein